MKENLMSWRRQQLQPLELPGKILLLALAYFLAGEISFSLSVSSNIVTPVIFMAEGVALAATILWGYRVWPGIFLGQLVLALFNGLPWLPAAEISAINSIEALIGAWLFTRLGIHTRLNRIRDVGLLLLLIVAVLQPFSATLGNLVLWLNGTFETPQFADSWRAWWFGNLIGQIAITPLLLSLHATWKENRVSDTKAWQPALLISLILLICTTLTFTPHDSGANLAIALTTPLIVVLAARHGMRATTSGILLIILLNLFYARQGGSLYDGSQGNSYFDLNLYLLSMTLVGQFVAALFAERQEIEQALVLSHNRLNEAQRIAGVGSWTLDLRSQQLEWSDEIYRIFEIDPQHFGASYAAFLAAIHPDDRKMVDEAYTRSVANRQPYTLIHRLLFADGRIKHVQECCETLYAADGTPLLSQGTTLDVTAIKQAEERLHIYANVFTHSRDAIVITDRDNNIVEVNPAFTGLSGYSSDEVQGKNPRFLASGKTAPGTYVELWQSLTENGVWQGELWDRRKDGSVYIKSTTISSIQDPNGHVMNYMARFFDITARKAAEDQMKHLAHHDALTGLSNRFSLDARLEQALLSAQRERTQLAVIFIDMDRFKNINDTYGHHIGDLLLIEVAHRLKQNVRASDIVARLGGDEFIVIITGDGDERSVTEIAGKLVEQLAQPYLLDDLPLSSSPSLGFSLYPEHGSDARTLMMHADVAMYHAKKEGRNRFKCFIPTMNVTLDEPQALKSE